MCACVSQRVVGSGAVSAAGFAGGWVQSSNLGVWVRVDLSRTTFSTERGATLFKRSAHSAGPVRVRIVGVCVWLVGGLVDWLAGWLAGWMMVGWWLARLVVGWLADLCQYLF